VLEVLGDGPRADVDRTGDGHVGPAGRGQVQHLDLAAGEVGQPVAGVRRHGGAGPLPAARPLQRLAERFGQDAQQRPVGLGEVRPGPVERDGALPVLARQRQVENDLILDRDIPHEFRVKGQPVELLAIEEVAYLDRRADAHGAVVDDHRVLVPVGIENHVAGRIHGSGRIFNMKFRLIRYVGNLIICHDITGHHVGQAGQGDLDRGVRIVQVRQAVDKLRGSLKSVQRNVHGCAFPPGALASLGAQCAYRHLRRKPV
jgi:hypothetical protein